MFHKKSTFLFCLIIFSLSIIFINPNEAYAAKYGFLFVPSTGSEGAIITIKSGGKNKLNSKNNPFKVTVKNFDGVTLVDSNDDLIELETTGNLLDNKAKVIVPSIVEDCSASVIFVISGGDISNEQEVPFIIKVNPLDTSAVQNSGINCSEDPNNIPILEPLTLDETLVLKGDPPLRFMESTGNADLMLAGPVPGGGLEFNFPVDHPTCGLLCDEDETVTDFTLLGDTIINGTTLKVTVTNGFMLTIPVNGGAMISAADQGLDLSATGGNLTINAGTVTQSANGDFMIESQTADTTVQSTAGNMFLKAPAGTIDVEMVSMDLVSSSGPVELTINNNGNYSVTTGGTVDISGGTTMLTASSAGLSFSAATNATISAVDDITLEAGANVILKKPANANVVELALAGAPTTSSQINIPVDVNGSLLLVDAGTQMITVGAGNGYALNSYVSDIEVTDGAGTMIDSFTGASYSGQIIAAAVAAGSSNITFVHSGCVADGFVLSGGVDFVASATEAVILRRMTFPTTCWVEIGRI